MGIYGFKILNYDVTNSMKRISYIMSSKIESIQPSESVKEAAKKMWDKNVSSLVVLNEGGQSIGIITERDIKRGVRIHDVLSK